jgi:hypothetical protein
MADFSLAEPFDIDDGSLDGLTPSWAFCLGVEWALPTSPGQQLQTNPDPFRFGCHTPNEKRLTALVQRHGRTCTVHWLHDDFPQYRWLSIS